MNNVNYRFLSSILISTYIYISLYQPGAIWVTLTFPRRVEVPRHAASQAKRSGHVLPGTATWMLKEAEL